MNSHRTTAEHENLLTHQRRDLIADLVDEKGVVRARELTDRFAVSAMTIRRDIEALAASQRVHRVHGGATRIERVPRRADEPGFRAKMALRRQEKTAIAAAAVRRVTPGSAIGIAAGTTTFQMAEHLSGIADLTVVTNSIPIANALMPEQARGTSVLITGGSPTPSSAIVGPLADRSLADLHLDQLFMGVHGIDEEAGFTTPNLAEAQTNQAFMRAARQVIVVADASKWGVVGLGTIAPLRGADVLITDSALTEQAASALVREIDDVQIVEPG